MSNRTERKASLYIKIECLLSQINRLCSLIGSETRRRGSRTVQSLRRLLSLRSTCFDLGRSSRRRGLCGIKALKRGLEACGPFVWCHDDPEGGHLSFEMVTDKNANAPDQQIEADIPCQKLPQLGVRWDFTYERAPRRLGCLRCGDST